jgi:PP-loop superfamily ATP-utilizing enzyme
LADELMEGIKKLESALLAFSDCVDSSTVGTLAYKALGIGPLAVTINSPLPHGELEEAIKVA